jgi:hypothetical protein
VTLRACLRLLLLAAMLLAPIGRIGIAQAMAVPASGAMTGHCAGMPAAAPAHHRGDRHPGAPQKHDERMAVDCMIACAAMASAPALIVAPPPVAAALPGAIILTSLTGIRPEADPPPPRRS